MPWIDITEREQEGWPPTTQSPYEQAAGYKEGNFFTMVADENFPCYVLFRALEAQGWSWDIGGGRHWCHMNKGDSYVIFSLWGQGHFGTREHDGISFEDYDGVWAEALPHVSEFMKWCHSTWEKFK
jgi:hypothetical protein